MRDTNRDRSRRSFLRTGTGALAVGSVVGLTGCSALPGSGSNGESEGPPFRENLVAYYSFDGDTGTTVADRSGGGNAAEIRGATRTDEARAGRALSFDGEDDVVRTPVAYADLRGGLTLAAWARNDDLSSGWGWVFTQRAPADQWSQLGVHGEGAGKLRWELRVGGSQATVDAPEGSVEQGTWHHWAGTWAEGEGLRLYIDGQQVATSADEQYCYRGCEAANTGSLSSSGPINIGAQGRETEYWTGIIDEATVYDRALSAGEVRTLSDRTSG